MSRKRRREEQLESGSDSFLDIVANIVGILIILIVIAGVRMSRAPVVTQTETDPVETLSEPTFQLTPPAPLDETPREPIPTSPASPRLQLATTTLGQPRELEWHVPSSPDGETTKDDEMIALRERQQSAINRVAMLKTQIATLEETLAKSSEQQERLAPQIASARSRLATLESAAAETGRARQGVLNRVQAIENQASQRDTLEHRIVPVGRLVDGREWHFELRDNKIAFIPIE